jgi:hypothetical protein
LGPKFSKFFAGKWKIEGCMTSCKNLGLKNQFFRHPLFTMNALIVDVVRFSVSLDSEFIQEKIKNFKK